MDGMRVGTRAGGKMNVPKEAAGDMYGNSLIRGNQVQLFGSGSKVTGTFKVEELWNSTSPYNTERAVGMEL